MSKDVHARIHARLDRRQEHINRLFAKLRRQVDEGVIGGEEGREWLEQHAVGRGVNLCCGDFSIGDSLGVDLDPARLATDLWCGADRFFYETGELDYVVTNYLECFADTVSVLQDWTRRLRSGGKFAIVCRNADGYSTSQGPLENHRRLHCFNLRILSYYLARSGLTVVDSSVSLDKKELRVLAVKP